MKLILLKFVIILSVLFLFGFYSCNSTLSDNEFANTIEYRDLIQEDTFLLRLSDSQIDSIGILHNKFLKEIINSDSFGSIVGFYNRLFNTINNFSIEHEIPINAKTLFESNSNTVSEFGVSEKESIMLQEILNKIYSMSNYSKFSQEIDLLEREIISTMNLSIKELKSLKLYISIAKHSAYFWTPKEYGGLGNKIQLYGNPNNDNEDIQLRSYDEDCHCWCGAKEACLKWGNVITCPYICVCGCDDSSGGGGADSNTGDSGSGTGNPWNKNKTKDVIAADVEGAAVATYGLAYSAYRLGAEAAASGPVLPAIDIIGQYAIGIGGASLMAGIKNWQN